MQAILQALLVVGLGGIVLMAIIVSATWLLGWLI